MIFTFRRLSWYYRISFLLIWRHLFDIGIKVMFTRWTSPESIISWIIIITIVTFLIARVSSSNGNRTLTCLRHLLYPLFSKSDNGIKMMWIFHQGYIDLIKITGVVIQSELQHLLSPYEAFIWLRFIHEECVTNNCYTCIAIPFINWAHLLIEVNIYTPPHSNSLSWHLK